MKTRFCLLVALAVLFCGAVLGPARGQVFVFMSDRAATGGHEIFTANADGSGMQQWTFDGKDKLRPDLSPDLTRVVYQRPGAITGDIYVLDLVTGVDTPITSDGGANDNQQPRWSPDGTKIVFVKRFGGGQNYQVWSMNADGNGQTPLVVSAGPNAEPRWSPDGTKIAYISHDDTPGYNVWVLYPDGTRKNISKSPGSIDQQPVWSPDGTMIAFLRQDINGADTPDLWVMNSDGSAQTRLTTGIQSTGDSLAWTPYGTEIFIPSQLIGDPEILALDLNTGIIRDVTQNPAWDTEPSFGMPPVLTALTLTPTSVVGGKAVIGKVVLNHPAPAAGIVIPLADNVPSTTAPASVTVPGGASTATFTITTAQVFARRTGAILAAWNGSLVGANLAVQPVGIASLTINPTTVKGGFSATGTVTLTGSSKYQTVVSLSSSTPGVAKPAVSYLVFPPGATTRSFTINTQPVMASTPVVIHAQAVGTAALAGMFVKP